MSAQSEKTLLQGNLNHCRAAQDLVAQTLAEWGADAGVVAEPYFVPPNWFGDLDGTVAIIPRPSMDLPPLTSLEKGSGFVAVAWGENALLGVYFSPNRSLAEFERLLVALSGVLSRLTPRQVVVLGDFNAKSVAWGNPRTDARGRALEAWAVSANLSLLNRGATHTCVRLQGGSVVDLSFATPAIAATVASWRVELTETLSDHRYIRIGFSTRRSQGTTGRSSFPRWAITHLDRQMASEVAFVQDWLGPPPSLDVDVAASHMREILTEVCDSSMPRSRRPPPRKAVFWWSAELADLRKACMAARRRYQRLRRRRQNRDLQGEARFHLQWQESKKALKAAIGAAKDAARAEMLEGLDADPWGRPYKMVRNKLRPIGPPLTETLPTGLLYAVVTALFPNAANLTPPKMNPPPGMGPSEDIPPVSSEEFAAATLCLKLKKTAPGPDGVPARAMAIATSQLEERFRVLFDRCFSSGRFPKPWKEGVLVLLRKDGRPADSPSGYRPIVLLDEASKTFERVIAARLKDHLAGTGPDLSEAQFGFREGRSTIDAIHGLKTLCAEAKGRGQGVLAISFDIANAFNSLPHCVILEALRYHRVPKYLAALLSDYLRDREVLFVSKDGGLERRRATTGVPQGSVLGPLLWNVGYNWVLRGALLPGMAIICYADDTLVTARGRTYGEAACLASAGGTLVAGRMRRLGLRVALEKTEALYFPGPRQRAPSDAHIMVAGVRVEVKAQMKYLGLILDAKWEFGPHFRGLAPRLLKAANAFSWLLPNLGGPKFRCRRLYAGVLRSMALYGAPIWADTLHRGENVALLRRPQRAIAQRIARAYCTVAHAAACSLASTPPWELEAGVLAAVYHQTAARKALGERLTPEERGAVRREAYDEMVLRWRLDLANARYGRRVTEVVGPLLDSWLERRHGFLTYRLVQVLSGHGCFGSFLYRIGREESPLCHHCGAAEDTAQHTLEACTAFEAERRVLRGVAGPDLSLAGVVNAMLADDRVWRAVSLFCESVISQKETSEREREADPSAPQLRRRRVGRARTRNPVARPALGGTQRAGTGVPQPSLHASPSVLGGGGVVPCTALAVLPPS